MLRGDAEVSFATAEVTLNMGFVAGRVRVLRFMHLVADAGLVTSVLAALLPFRSGEFQTAVVRKVTFWSKSQRPYWACGR